MSENVQVVTFTVDEINQILNVLGEIPAKYSLDLVTFIRGTAQKQLKKDEEVTDVEVVSA
jgi:hypothetical protein